MSEDEYKSKLAELDKLMSELSAYEDKHFPIAEPTPEAAAEFRAEQMGIKKPQLRG